MTTSNTTDRHDRLRLRLGWEVAAGFHRTFEESGDRSCKKLWPPLGTTDFGPYIAQLKRDVDAVYAVFSGADACALQTVRRCRTQGRLPLIGGGTFTDEHVLRTMGDEVLGVTRRFHYSAALTTPGNQKFARTYEGKVQAGSLYYSEAPMWPGSSSASAWEGLAETPRVSKRLVGTLRKTELADTPRGPIRSTIMQSIQTSISESGAGRGKLQNTVIHTFPNVSQFLTYKPEDF